MVFFCKFIEFCCIHIFASSRRISQNWTAGRWSLPRQGSFQISGAVSVGHFFNQEPRPVFHLYVNLAEIFANHADTKYLNPTEKIRGQHHGSPTGNGIVGEHPHPEGPKADEYGTEEYHKTRHSYEPQRYDRKRSDSVPRESKHFAK